MSDDEDIARLQRAFGGHVHSLRRARRLTQENLAVRSELSADTIRRLEHGGFSPIMRGLFDAIDGTTPEYRDGHPGRERGGRGIGSPA